MSIVTGLLNQSIDTIYSISQDGYGDVTETTLYTDTSCRWQDIFEQEVLATGKTITYNVKVWLFPDVVVREGYRFVKDNKTYTAKKLNMKYDLDGNKSHWEVYLN